MMYFNKNNLFCLDVLKVKCYLYIQLAKIVTFTCIGNLNALKKILHLIERKFGYKGKLRNLVIIPLMIL